MLAPSAASEPPEAFMDTRQYVHTLVFACPACSLPMAVCRMSDTDTLNAIASIPLRTRCSYCDKVGHVSIAAAKQHYVAEWPEAWLSAHP
jgi:hypothetical protein